MAMLIDQLMQPLDLFGAHLTYRPSLEEMQSRWQQNFTHAHEPKSRTVRSLHVELMVSAEQALRGGSAPIEVPVARVCQRCGGTGSTGYYTCDLCDGHGIDWQTARIDVLLSPPVRDGSTIDIPLRHLGVENFVLRVQVHVTA